MSSNSEIVVAAMTGLFVDRDTSVIEKYWSDVYYQHNPDIPDGREDLAGIVAGLSDDFRYEPGMVVAEGDLVMIHGRYTGWAPEVRVAVDIFRLQDGRIVEHWDVMQEERSTVSGRPTSSGAAMPLPSWTKLSLPAPPPAGGPTPMPAAVLARNALLECGMTAGLLFVIVTAVRWLIGDPGIASSVDSVRVRVALVAAVAALTVLAIILSPAGRRSGAHVNPAITVALWQMRAFPSRSVAPYIVSQLIGSVLGAGLARLVWGAAVSRYPTRYGVIGPASGWHWWQVSLVEAACLVAVTLVVGFFLAHPVDRTRKALPYALAAVTFLIAAGLGTLSGAAVNPARQLGPAIWSGDHAFLGAFLIAPVIGALLGALIHLRLVRQPVRTYTLSGEAPH